MFTCVIFEIVLSPYLFIIPYFFPPGVNNVVKIQSKMYNNFHTEFVHTCKSLLSKFYTKHENALSFTCTTCLRVKIAFTASKKLRHNSDERQYCDDRQ